MIGVHSKGKHRHEKIAISLTFQGFEPDVFKTAFPVWLAFPRVGIDVNAEISEEVDEESLGSDEELKADV